MHARVGRPSIAPQKRLRAQLLPMQIATGNAHRALNSSGKLPLAEPFPKNGCRQSPVETS